MGSHIRNMAKSLIAELGITRGDMGGVVLGIGAQELYARRSKDVKARLLRMRPETLGRVAAQGRAWDDMEGPTLYYTHCGTWLDKHASGKDLLLEIACTAIIAEMGDILDSEKLQEYPPVPSTVR